MMTNKEKKQAAKVSRLLAMVLRHGPEKIGITLDPQGWVNVPILLAALKEHGSAISAEQLNHIVATSDKKRFTLSEDRARIRAAQGHSVNVDIAVAAKVPPAELYHGTAEATLDAIMREGLRPMRRRQVHLSADQDTALKVGSRHGAPVILIVDTKAMHEGGAEFFQADNGVWLTDHVAPAFLRVANKD